MVTNWIRPLTNNRLENEILKEEILVSTLVVCTCCIKSHLHIGLFCRGRSVSRRRVSLVLEASAFLLQFYFHSTWSKQVWQWVTRPNRPILRSLPQNWYLLKGHRGRKSDMGNGWEEQDFGETFPLHFFTLWKHFRIVQMSILVKKYIFSCRKNVNISHCLGLGRDMVSPHLSFSVYCSCFIHLSVEARAR